MFFTPTIAPSRPILDDLALLFPSGSVTGAVSDDIAERLHVGRGFH